mgnify:CR=1 FL=1
MAAEIAKIDVIEHQQAAAKDLLDKAAAAGDIMAVRHSWDACQRNGVGSFFLCQQAAAALLKCEGGHATDACELLDAFPGSAAMPSHAIVGAIACSGLQSIDSPAQRRVGLAAALALSRSASSAQYALFQVGTPAVADHKPQGGAPDWAAGVSQQLLLPLLAVPATADSAVSSLAAVLLAAARQLQPPPCLQAPAPAAPHGVDQLSTEQALFWVACLPPSATAGLSSGTRSALLQSVLGALRPTEAPFSSGALSCALHAVSQLAPAGQAGEQCAFLLSAPAETAPGAVDAEHFALALAALRSAPHADASACLLNDLLRWAHAQGCSDTDVTRVPDALLRPEVQQLLSTAMLTAAQQVSAERPLRVAAVLRTAHELLALPQRACDLSLLWDSVLTALCVWEDGAALARFTAAMARGGVKASPAGLSSIAAARGRARQRTFELAVARAGVHHMQPVPPPAAGTPPLGQPSDSSLELTGSSAVAHTSPRSSASALAAVQPSEAGAVAIASHKGAPPPRTVYAMAPLALPRTPPFSDEQWALVLQGVMQVTASPLQLLQAARTALGMSVTKHSVQGGNKAEHNTGTPSSAASAASVLHCGPSWAVRSLAAAVRSLAEATGEPLLAAAAGSATSAADRSTPAAHASHCADSSAAPGVAAAWAVCSQVPARVLGRAGGPRTPSDKNTWTPGNPDINEHGVFQLAASSPSGRVRPQALHSAVVTDLRRVLAAAASGGDVASAVDTADAVQLFNDELDASDFEALLAACEAAGQPNRADTLLGAMKVSLGRLTPTAVACAVQAHADAGAPAAAAMHLMTAVEAGLQLPEHVFWSVLNACGDAGAVLATHDVLSAGHDTGHIRLQHVNGALHKGLLNVCGLRSGALTCVVWDALRSIRRDSELGRPVPHGLRVFCSKSQRVVLEAVFQAMDPPLQCNHVAPPASRPFLGVAPEDLIAWLTTPSSNEAAAADEWAQSTSLPMRLAAVTGIASGRTAASQAQLLLGEGSQLAAEDFGMLQPVADDAADSLSAEQAEMSAEYAQWHARFKKQSSYARTRTQVDSTRAQAAATRRQVARERQQAAEKRNADARASMRPEDVRTLGKVLGGRDGGRAWAGNGLHMATARTLKQRQGAAMQDDNERA